MHGCRIDSELLITSRPALSKILRFCLCILNYVTLIKKRKKLMEIEKKYEDVYCKYFKI